MAIIGSAEVEVRANVRKLGSDITDSFDNLSKEADKIADRMGKSISDSLKKNLDGLTIQVNLDDSILDDIIEVEEQIKRLSGEKIKLNLDDSEMDKLNDYSGKTLNYDVDLDTTELDAMLKSITSKKIKIGVDERELAGMRKRVERAVESIPESSRSIDIDPKISNESKNNLSKGMKDILSSLHDMADDYGIGLNLDADVTEVSEKLKELKEAAEDSIDIGVALDNSDLEEINAAIEAVRTYNESNAIDLEVDVHMAKALAELAFLSRKRFVEVVPKMNMAAITAAQGVLAGFTGFNIMKEHTEDFIRSLTELDKQLPQLATNLALMSAAVPVAGWGAGSLTMLIGDVAALSGLLIPGSAIVAGYATSMMFLNNAFSKPNKKKYIPEITAQLDAFGSAVAGDFWKVAKPSYSNFAFKTLPALYKASKGLNTGIAELASSFWDSIGAVLATDRGMNNLTEIVGNIQGGMKGLGDAIEPVMQALLTFVRVGSSYLPGLGKHIANLAEKFDSWMQSMDESGALEDWADAGINSLKELGSIIGSTVGIVYSLYQAADAVGFPGLTELADGLSRVNETLKTDAAQGALIRLGTAVKDAFNTIAASLSWVGPLFTKHFDSIVGDAEGVGGVIRVMGDIVGGVLEGIGSALTNTGLVEAFFGLFESMSTAVGEFGPAFESIGTIMAVTFDFLGSALENITPILEQFFENLANDAILIKPSFMAMLDIIGDWGPRVMDIVGTVTNAVAKWIGDLDPVLALAGLAFVALSPIILNIGLVIGGFILTVAGLIAKIAAVPAVISTLAASGGVIGTIFTWIGVTALELGSTIGAVFGRIGTFITTAFSGVGVFIANVFKGIGVAAGTAVAGIRTFFAPLTGWIAGLFSTMSTNVGLIFQGLMIEIRAVLTPLTTFVSGLFSRIASSAGMIFQGLMIEVRTLLGPTLTGLFSRLGGSIGTLIGSLGNLGGKGFGGLLSKITAFIPGIGWIVSAFITAFTASEELRSAVGGFLVNAFKTLAAFIEPLLGPLKDLFGVIMDVSMDIGAVLAPAFTSVFNILNSLMPIVQLVAKLLGEVLGAAITILVGAIKAAWAMIKPILSGAVTFVSSIFNGIADIISGVIDVIVNLFQGDFAGAFESLKGIGTSIWDALKGALSGLGEMIGGIFTGAMDAGVEVISGLGDAIIGILDGFDLFPQAQAIIQSLVDGFGAAVNAVKDWLVDLTQKIIEWKGPPANDATLLNDAGSSIIMSLVDGFKSAVEAVFTFLQELTQQIVDVVMSIIDGVVTVFQTGWDVLVTIVQTVWGLIVTVIQTVWTTILAVIQGYINLVVTVFQTGWAILTTVVQAVWDLIVVIIQTVWLTITTVIQTYIDLVVAIFQAGWAFLTEIVTTVFTGVLMVIQTVMLGIQTFIQIALTTIQNIFLAIWTAIVVVVTTVWNAIRTNITVAINAVRTIIATVMTGIMTVITTIWTTIQTVTLTVWNAIKTLIGLGLAAIKALFTGNFAAFRSIIQTAWNVIKSTTSSVWNAIRSAISSVLNTIRSVISSVFNTIRSTISSVMNTIRSTITSIWNAIRSAITSVINSIRSGVTSGFNAIRSVVSSVMNAIRSVTSSVWNSIRSVISSVISSIRSVISSGMSAVRSAISSAWNAVRSITSSAWNGIVSAVTSAISNLMGKVRGIPGQIRGALGNLGSLLTGAGRSIIQGLINGVSGMIGSLKSKFSSITSMIPDWKGPPDTDAHLLTNAGELIMQGLIEGLESKYGAVKNSLQGFTGDLSQTVGTQIGADVGLSTSVRNTALSDAERRLSYRSNTDSMLQSNGDGIGREVHLHFHNTMVNESEIITVVNRELGRGV